MSATEIVSTLAGVDLFAGLSPKVLGRIAEAGHESRYEPGASVVVQGDSVSGFKAFSPNGVEMHVVLEGAARVDVNGLPVTVLGPGKYFGELSLIDGGPRSADVVADVDGLRTLALSKWTFEDLIEKHPEIALPILRVVTARLRALESTTG
jgi:CRP/FNR family cyclic AMP-dependent transcriptional regulator